jgi:hypothetical protein
MYEFCSYESILFNGKLVKSKSYYPDLLEVTLPTTNKVRLLTIN